MASLQERLQMNRALLDNWSIREQLCLASAVSCIGDKNWVQVSRNVKKVCGNNNNECISRPADWFSPECCSLQYAHLLENAETGKRKKRSNEGNSSPATLVEILKEKRIQELKTEIRKQQEEFAKIHATLQKIHSPNLSEDEMREMWRKIEQEEEEQRIAEMKLENQLREREQRKQDLQRNWRLNNQGDAMSLTKQENTAVVDMDVEEIIGVSKPIVPAQQQQQQQTATSPLLSSLLKSPTATAPTITTLLTSGSIPNANLPAITLNSDLIPPEKAVQLLSRPICGPPVGDAVNASNIGAHNLLSPSQSAPTLSMLLEKNKTASATGMNQTAAASVNAELISNATTTKVAEFKKEAEPIEIVEDVAAQGNAAEGETNIDLDEPDPNEEQQLMEVFKNIGNIELDIDVAAVIDDEEVDFLKGVDDESPRGTVEPMDFENKTEEANEPNANDQSDSKYEEKSSKSVTNKDEDETKLSKAQTENASEAKVIKIETSSDDSNDNIPLAAVATLENKERNLLTPTTETDDKSIEQNFLKAKVESAITCAEDTNKNQHDQLATTEIASPFKIEIKESLKVEKTDEEQSDSEMAEKMKSKADTVEEVFADTTETHDVEHESVLDNLVEEDAIEEEIERFSTPIGDDKCSEKEADVTENLLTVDDSSKSDVLRTDNDNAVDNSTADGTLPSEEPTNTTISQLQENTNTNESVFTAAPPPPPPSHISIADTDEDSCTTDTSIITIANKQEEKRGTSSISSGTKHTTERGTSQTRKSGSHDAMHKSTEDSDSSSGNRASKRSLLSILSNLSSTKSAQTIQLALSDEQLKSKYQKTCYRRLDFQTIKKSIENGTIRSVIDLQRDLLQLAQNIIFLFHATTSTYKAAEVFKHEMQSVREFVFNTHEFEVKTEKEVKEIKQAAGKQGRTGSRKSLRIS